jgi:DNA-binding transcriptional LysR family regulator
VAEIQGLRRGVLRLGTVNTAQYFVTGLLSRVCERYPQVEVGLEVENAERLAGRLRNNMDSIYVFSRPPANVDIEATPFLDNPLVAVAARSRPLAGQRGIPLDRLAEERFVMREAGSETRRLAERLFTEHGLDIDIRMVSSQTEAIKRASAAGMGVCVLSARTLDGDEQLVPLDVDRSPIHHKRYLVHRRDRGLSPVARSFVEFLADA